MSALPCRACCSSCSKLEVLAGPGGGAPAATDGSEGEDGGIDGGGSGGGAMPGQMTFGRRSLRIQAELAPVWQLPACAALELPWWLRCSPCWGTWLLGEVRAAAGGHPPSRPCAAAAPARCLTSQALHPRHTLALLLLACWCQLEAAGPLDVLRWALDGRLPYVAFAAEEGAVLQQYRNILGGELIAVRGREGGRWRAQLEVAVQLVDLRQAVFVWPSLHPRCFPPYAPRCGALPAGVPSPKALLLNASTMGKRLGLACPPLSPALWLARYLADLELSQVCWGQLNRRTWLSSCCTTAGPVAFICSLWV